MAKDLQSRKWQLTFNNPVEHGYSHEVIKERLALFSSLVYWCMSDEIGNEGTYHTHLFVVFSSAVRFTTIRNKFEGAHLEIVNGTSKQNRDYIRKEGKWADDDKSETNLSDTFEEYGEMPLESQGKRSDITKLYQMIKDGLDNYEIVEESPSYLLQLDKIEKTRQMIREKTYRQVWRDVETTYIFGESGAGKTRSVMEKYGYDQVYRITDYDHPFDSYNGQDIIVFEEFRSSLRINDMLNYLDGYPLYLPCRYMNRVACFTKVYIITNIPLEYQYVDVQNKYSEIWGAFLRRIKRVVQYIVFGPVNYDSLEEYFERNKPVDQKDLKDIYRELTEREVRA